MASESTLSPKPSKKGIYISCSILVVLALAYWLYSHEKHARLNWLLLANVENADVSFIRDLLEQGANANVNYDTGNAPVAFVPMVSIYPTPLIGAASSGRIEIIRLLIAYGADVNAQAGEGLTALKSAVRNKHLGVVAILIAHGANVNIKDADGKTVLDWAIQTKQDKIARYLRRHGARVGGSSKD